MSGLEKTEMINAAVMYTEEEKWGNCKYCLN